MRQVLLLASAALYLGFGIVLSASPEALADHLGILASTSQARTELRAFYGGLELGLAAFLAICAFRRPWIPAGCAALALSNGGIAAVRIAGLIADRSASSLMFSFLAVEITLCILGVLAARRGAPTRHPLPG